MPIRDIKPADDGSKPDEVPSEGTMDFFLALPPTTTKDWLQLTPHHFKSLSSRNTGVPFIPLFKDCVQAGLARLTKHAELQLHARRRFVDLQSLSVPSRR